MAKLNRAMLAWLFLLGGVAVIRAGQATWNGTLSPTWATAGNWSGSVVVPGVNDAAIFNNAGNGRTTISLGATGTRVDAVIFDTENAAPYTIGSGVIGSQTLNVNGSGGFDLNSTVTNVQTFNAALILSTANGNRTLGFTNNSPIPGPSLIFNGGMATTNTGTKTVFILGTGNVAINGNMTDGTAGGNLALTKNNTGTLTLAGVNTYSGPTVVNAGTMVNSSSGGSAAGSATLTVGNLAGSAAVLDIVPGANFTNYSIAIGENSSVPGAIFQSGGTFTQVQGASIADFRIGDGSSSYGYYQLSAGTLNANEVGVGGGNGGNGTMGVMDITGGTFNDAGWITVGRGGTMSSGVLNVSGGGSIICAGAVGGSKISFNWGSAPGLAVINLFNGGSIIGPASTAYVLDLATVNNAGTLNVMNLDSYGSLAIGGVTAVNAGPVSLLNFNGGALRATVDNPNFMTSGNVHGVFIYPGGATINDGGFSIVDSIPLQSPAGYGVSSIAIANGGSGYVGAPLVSIAGGSGSGATAIARMDFTSGTVTNILITNPGSGYASGDALTVTFIGGGGGGAVAGTPILAANGSGALTKTGVGTLTLSGANTYTGGTTIAGGTLALGFGGSLASTNINVDAGTVFDVSAIGFVLGGNQSLMGNGTVNGSMSTAAGAKIFASTDGGIGTNTFKGNLTLVSGASCNFDLGSAASGANDEIILNGANAVLSCDGATIGIGCGASLDQANDYTLFNLTGSGATVAGNFNPTPVWTRTTPANAGGFSIVTVGNKVVLHYNGGATNLPVVTNLPATAVQPRSATLNGQVLSTGGEFPTVTIYYGPADGGQNPAAWMASVPLGLQIGSFAAAVSNLTGNTTYYFAASASNSAGTGWATPSKSFTTLPPNLAVITNLAATAVQGNSAILNGQVVSIGSHTPAVTLYYGPSEGGTNASAWANSVYLGQEGGSYSYAISGLTTNTAYYFTAAAVNDSGTAWAAPSFSFATLPTGSAISVLTYHYDNSRDGANTNETVLTPAIVNTNNFGLLTKYTVDGYVYTEPLIVPNVTIPGQGTHNIVIVATEHDSVYAFDADGNLGTNGGLLWHTNLGVSALSANQNEFGARYCGNCYPDIVPEVGVTGTPVIDPATGTLYLDVFTREVTSTTNFYHRIHALNITNGLEQPYSPVVVTASVPGKGRDSVGGVMTFNPARCNERPALTLAGGVLYVAYAGYADTDPYHGWVIGYNATNLVQLTDYVFNSTPNATTAAFGPNAAEGGVWMGGNGLCVDANTNLYFETGNGSFSANTNGGDYADSFIRLSTTNKLALTDYFTPYNQLALANADLDLGACGPILLPDAVGSVAHPHLLAGTGKSGKLYIVDRDNMGHYNGTGGNDNNIVQSYGATGQTWSSPTYFNNQLYLQPSGGPMEAYTITNAQVATPAASTAPVSFGAMNGAPVISANGTSNGIVWVVNGAGGTGTEVLYALAATNLSQQLYNSSQLSRDVPGNGIKMITPTVANGKVYIGAQYTLSIYGLTAFLAAPVISPNGGLFTNSVMVTLTDSTPGAAIYYTLDGTAPTAGATLYTGPFMVTNTVNLQAIAVKSGAVNSGVASASFINSAAVGNGTGLLGQYWTNTSSSVFTNESFSVPPTLARTDAMVNFDWSTVGPDPSIGQTNFATRWTGAVQPPFGETYTFTVMANDGVRLWVNDQLLIDDWHAHSATVTNSGSILLNAQQLYNLRLDYFQQTGNAMATLLWSSPSTAQAIVPQTQLYPYTNPPPAVIMAGPADGSAYTAAASVTVSAEADAQYNAIASVDFYANGTLLGSLTNSSDAPLYTLTATGLPPGSYALTAVATDGSGLGSTSAPVNITVSAGSGLAYGLTTNAPVRAFLNMPATFNGALPLLLSGTGAFSDTPNRIAAGGLVPYQPNTPLWSDAAVKSRYMAVPNNGGPITPDEQIGFLPTNSWTFPAGTVFVKNFDLVVNETNASVPLRRLETRLLVRDINGAVYGVTYKWRPDDSDADLLTGALNEDILITNAFGVRTQTWYYPSPADCLTCHTPLAGYVLGVSTRQINGNLLYAATGNTDNQLRTLNRLGLFNPAINEANITNYEHLSALTNLSASLEERARSYLDANCAQCHRPGNSIEANFDARYDTPLAGQNIMNYPAQHSLGIDGACIVKAKDVWRSVLLGRINTNAPAIKMPPLARNVIDTNAVQVFTDWINSLPGVPALAPPGIIPNGGSFVRIANVALQSPDPNASIYYTLDGSLPTTNSLLYTGAFNLFTNATVSASAFETNYMNSAEASAAFLIQPLYFTYEGFSNSVFRLRIAGMTGSNYVLEASTNLQDWTPLLTNTAVTNIVDLMDPQATNFPYRFYRILQR
ncbi:MAG TPA: FN3 associated domain-containing protein [Candidatus Angelobacter sp.]|nr:FN3 associated domain-containing protein [Candidatus Angelobacter sp.]